MKGKNIDRAHILTLKQTDESRILTVAYDPATDWSSSVMRHMNCCVCRGDIHP